MQMCTKAFMQGAYVVSTRSEYVGSFLLRATVLQLVLA